MKWAKYERNAVQVDRRYRRHVACLRGGHENSMSIQHGMYDAEPEGERNPILGKEEKGQLVTDCSGSKLQNTRDVTCVEIMNYVNVTEQEKAT